MLTEQHELIVPVPAVWKLKVQAERWCRCRTVKETAGGGYAYLLKSRLPRPGSRRCLVTRWFRRCSLSRWETCSTWGCSTWGEQADEPVWTATSFEDTVAGLDSKWVWTATSFEDTVVGLDSKSVCSATSQTPGLAVWPLLSQDTVLSVDSLMEKMTPLSALMTSLKLGATFYSTENPYPRTEAESLFASFLLQLIQ